MADQILRNEYGEVVSLIQPVGEPRAAVPEAAFGGETPTQIANRYIKQHMAEMGLSQSRTEDDEAALADTARAEDPIVRFCQEKDVAGAKVVMYEQMVMGLPLFYARMGVQVDTAQRAVTSVQSSMHGKVKVANPDQKSDEQGDQKLSATALKKTLGVDLENMADGRIHRQVVYRFEPDQRVEKVEDEHEGCFGEHAAHTPELPSLPKKFKKGNHYIVNEVLFRASRQEGEPPVNWRALVEPESGAVLYIRALVSWATGMVYVKDPQTQTGANVTGASSNATLNPFRSSVPLQGITPSTPQPLSGEYVELAETSAPVIPAPTVPDPTGAFNFDVRTDHFSAVNAYYHCDNLFRTMEDYGFNVFTYFNRTSFPVPVDHRALGNTVNAQAPGNATGTGLGELRFALLQSGQPVGIATSNRVVWHEFGHGLLWDHVNSPNFGFAHSAGDSLAAILNDPGSNETDRFDTFPWVQEATPIGRRHDRAVADGWAWFGPQYNTQYRGEQMLSTTLFRLYRSIGGDSTHIGTQTRAAQTVSYLIFKAIGLLTSTTRFPEVFVFNMQNSDITTSDFKGIPGGALHKVIRWAFEKQGLFQDEARPDQGNTVSSEGNPPDVDVYIDDGRNGEYEYLPNHWSCQDMWVRHSADGGLTHQQPLVGVTNFMYVRVKNRGLQTASGVNVAAYHCLPGTGLAFPDEWIPMDTPNLSGGFIPPSGETIVGPFDFVPTQVGHECLLAIAEANGDPGNDTTITGTIPENRFVPYDNNIGQRNVHPVFPSLRALVEFLRRHRLWIRNPLRKPVVCQIIIELPRFLTELGWQMRVVSAGGAKFELGPRDRREVVLSISPGRDFAPQDARRAIAQGDHEFKIETLLHDEISGGMTYQLSFDVEERFDAQQEGEIAQAPSVQPQAPTGGASRPLTIEEILRVLGSQTSVTGELLDRRIRTVRLELDLFDDKG